MFLKSRRGKRSSALDRDRLPASTSLSSVRSASLAQNASQLLSDQRPKFPAPPVPENAEVMPLVRGSQSNAKCHVLSFVEGIKTLHELEPPVSFHKEVPEDTFQERDVHEGAGSQFGSKEREEARRRRYERYLQRNPDAREPPRLCFKGEGSAELVGTQQTSRNTRFKYFFVTANDNGDYVAIPADHFYEVRLKPRQAVLGEEEIDNLMTSRTTQTRLERMIEERRLQDIEERRALRERMRLVINEDEDARREKEEDEEERVLAKMKKDRQKDNSYLAKEIAEDGVDDIDNLEDGFEPPDEDKVYAIPDQSGARAEREWSSVSVCVGGGRSVSVCE